jgi:hypothetical protein
MQKLAILNQLLVSTPALFPKASIPTAGFWPDLTTNYGLAVFKCSIVGH